MAVELSFPLLGMSESLLSLVGVCREQELAACYDVLHRISLLGLADDYGTPPGASFLSRGYTSLANIVMPLIVS